MTMTSMRKLPLMNLAYRHTIEDLGMHYTIEPSHEPRGQGNGWELCDEHKATCFFICDKDGEIYEGLETRQQADEWIEDHPYTKSMTSFYVEITVCALVEAESLNDLTDRISNEGWTVSTLLDHKATSGPIIIRDHNNDQIAEI